MSTYCAGCGVDVLPAAPRETDVGGAAWHPGCWAAVDVSRDECLTPTAREHLAQARAALARPSDRRSA